MRGGIISALAKSGLYPYCFIPFGGPLAPGGRADLQLSRACRNSKVNYRCVLRFAGSCRNNGLIAVPLRIGHGLYGLAYGADLVHLDKDGIAAALDNASSDTLYVRRKEVVPDKLYFAAETRGGI